MNPAYLEFRLSGGSANTDPAASLGGVESSLLLVGNTVTGISNVTGVTVLDAPGSAVGAGTLTFVASGTAATWAGSGASAGAPVNIGASGRYVLEDSNAGRLHISVVAGSLPGGDQSDTLTVARKLNGLFDDISSPESLAGDTEYRCFYVHNAHPSSSCFDVKIYIDSPATGADTIELGLDPAGIAGTATTVADESSAPAGVTFSSAEGYANALAIGTLAAGESIAVWQKRTVPSSTSAAEPNDSCSITVSLAY